MLAITHRDFARLEKSRKAVKPLWPEEDCHVDELLADHAAVEFVGESASKANFNLMTVMKGSFISLTAVALDSWFKDGSAITDSHPSAFARAHGLLAVWLEFLGSHTTRGWRETKQPTKNQLLEVAHTFVFVDWVAGLYRDQRDGIAALKFDLNTYHDLLCIAAGLSQPFRVDNRAIKGIRRATV